jgi:hypothetical protein
VVQELLFARALLEGEHLWIAPRGPSKNSKGDMELLRSLNHPTAFVRALPNPSNIGGGIIAQDPEGREFFIKHEWHNPQNEEVAGKIQRIMGVNGVETRHIYLPPGHALHARLAANAGDTSGIWWQPNTVPQEYLKAVIQKWGSGFENVLHAPPLSQMGPDAWDDAIRSLAFHAVTGNSDAHSGNFAAYRNNGSLGQERRLFALDNGMAFQNYRKNYQEKPLSSILYEPKLADEHYNANRYVHGQILGTYTALDFHKRITRGQFAAWRNRSIEWADQMATIPEERWRNALRDLRQATPHPFKNEDFYKFINHPEELKQEFLSRIRTLPQDMRNVFDYMENEFGSRHLP